MHYLACIVLFAAFKAVESNSCACHVKFKTVGCFKDVRSDRALTELILTERDPSDPVSNGRKIEWLDFERYLPAFTCRCAEAAMKKGYKYFGLQFWGECWSGPTSQLNDKPYQKYSSDGRAPGCYGPEYEACKIGNDQNCIGADNRNYVYEIVQFDCPWKFERIGCYHDKKAEVSPLNEYIMTDREFALSGISSGRSVDWINFDTYLPEFACRCAKEAAERGYDIFGVQYYGECWSGAQKHKAYYGDGQAPEKCVDNCYQPCHEYHPFCTGTTNSNSVYRIIRQDKETCDVQYAPLGCYKENVNNRAFKTLIFNAQHPEEANFIGNISSLFQDETEYVSYFSCRCARRAMELGYKAFGISEKGGECWSGPEAHLDFEKYGQSNYCFNNHGANGAIFAFEITNKIYQPQNTT